MNKTDIIFKKSLDCIDLELKNGEKNRSGKAKQFKWVDICNKMGEILLKAIQQNETLDKNE